ncbi:MAG: FhaA domain-containing protein, partial [Capsulimonas sp.]|uniref:FhaA domain-containing protein n=1 Tax=Capsulimonas sp. TaxID=2494211 RepID=UPI0032675709
MDLFERFNSKFGTWYENLFGGDAGGLRPKDVLRKIIAAMEENRKEGLDSKVYVPNKFILELAVDDSEERDYLLSFLDEEELVSVLQRFMAQNSYHARGPLDFTIREIPAAEREPRQEKVRVKVRFEKGDTAPVAAVAPVSREPDYDLPTVAAVYEDDEEGTVPAVAWASLAVTDPAGRKHLFSLTKPVTTIGRSRNAANDLVLSDDGLVSKAHARIERERDGRFTLYDLASTNGVTVNGARMVDNRALAPSDEIVIGTTKLIFQQASPAQTASPAPRTPAAAARPAAAPAAKPVDGPRRAKLVAANGVEHLLASETLIGRAVTADLMIDDPSVATRHARIVSPDPSTYYLEDLESA